MRPHDVIAYARRNYADGKVTPYPGLPRSDGERILHSVESASESAIWDALFYLDEATPALLPLAPFVAPDGQRVSCREVGFLEWAERAERDEVLGVMQSAYMRAKAEADMADARDRKASGS